MLLFHLHLAKLQLVGRANHLDSPGLQQFIVLRSGMRGLKAEESHIRRPEQCLVSRSINKPCYRHTHKSLIQYSRDTCKVLRNLQKGSRLL